MNLFDTSLSNLKSTQLPTVPTVKNLARDDPMGISKGDFHKYPRTPHLAGSQGTTDDKHLGSVDTQKMVSDPSLIIEEKLDGTNVGIHFAEGQLVLQCRGHEITAGMHPQYDLFKKWADAKQGMLRETLSDRFVIYGEWMYARHSIWYRALSHYFFEFDILDKQRNLFLDLASRIELLEGTGIKTVPILHRGTIRLNELPELIGRSQFDSQFENPVTGQTDDLMEGLYFRTESDGIVTARSKFVRPEFTEKVKQSTHWKYEKMVPNSLAESADIWS